MLQNLSDSSAIGPAMAVALLTFFVVLQSMSTTSKINFTAAAASIKTALTGKHPSGQTEYIVPVFPKEPTIQFAPISASSTKKLSEKIKSQIDPLRLQDGIDLQKPDDESIVLRIKDSVLFAPEKQRYRPSHILF